MTTETNKAARIVAVPNSRHMYELGTDRGRIEVEANTRAQAAAAAKRAGYVVRDVNMVA
jgi:hypothetical protein